MSKEYQEYGDHLKAIIDSYSGSALSEDMSAPVVKVVKGQYVPGSTDDKPTVYVRLKRPALKSVLAGGRTRNERLKFIISAAVRSNTQEGACNDIEALFANLAQILVNHVVESGYWGASYLGHAFSTSDESPLDYGDFVIEAGTDGVIAHFQLLWSCDVTIATDSI